MPKPRFAIPAALFAVLTLVCVQAPAAQQSPRALVGTWFLTQAQRTDGAAPVAIQAPRGMIFFDGAGHVLELVTRGGRALYAANQATPDEALAAFTSYGGFWGSYKVDQSAGRLTYRVSGGISPNLASTELVRLYRLVGDQLTIESGAEPGFQGRLRTTWRRVPNIENLSATYRKVIGFWQRINEGQYLVSTDARVTEVARDPSVIVYAPSGYLGVHFIPAGRKRIDDRMPTGEEARASIEGYVSYIATLGLYPGHIIHHPVFHLNPNVYGVPLERDFEHRGDEIYLRFTGAPVQERQTRVTLKRLSEAADMMP